MTKYESAANERSLLNKKIERLQTANKELIEALKGFIHSVEHEGVSHGRVGNAAQNAFEAIQKHSIK